MCARKIAHSSSGTEKHVRLLTAAVWEENFIQFSFMWLKAIKWIFIWIFASSHRVIHVVANIGRASRDLYRILNVYFRKEERFHETRETRSVCWRCHRVTQPKHSHLSYKFTILYDIAFELNALHDNVDVSDGKVLAVMALNKVKILNGQSSTECYGVFEEHKFKIDFLLIATIHRDMVAIFSRAHCTATDITVWRNPNGKWN